MLSNQRRAIPSEKKQSPVAARYHLVKRGACQSEAASKVDTKGYFPEHDSALPAYARDTLSAQARLVALSLLADGRIDSSEVELLGGQQGLGRLPLSKAEFFQVLNDFCADVSRMPATGGSYNVSPTYVEELLGKVTDPSLRRKTLNLMFDLIRSDGKLDPSEDTLLWNALDSWGLRVSHLGKAGAHLP